MVAAGQRPTTALLAGIAALVLVFARALHLALLLATVAVLLNLLGTRGALARMAFCLAAMLAAVKRFVADLAT